MENLEKNMEIELIIKKKEVAIVLQKDHSILPGTWEEIEDELADILFHAGYTGSIEDENTLNETRIRCLCK